MSTTEQDRESAQLAEEDARINELVNQRVEAKLAEISRQRAEERRTDDVRTGREHEDRHQQQAGRPSANPAVDDNARTLADALTGRLHVSSGDMGRVPINTGTVRMTETKRLAPWDGVFKQGEDEQAKFFIFRSNMVAMFAQEGVREVVLAEERIRVGKEGVSMDELRRVHSSDSVEKAITAWNLLITSITYMPILTQIIADGSPSGGWKFFLD